MSKKPFDPSVPLSRLSKEDVAKFFKGPGTDVQRLKKENPPLFDEYREAAFLYGILGPQPQTPAPYRTQQQIEDAQARKFSSEELSLHGKHSESSVREIFGSGNATAAQKLFETDRDKYEEMRLVGVSLGLVGARITPYVPAPKPVVEPGTVLLSDRFATECNLPLGTRLPIEQYNQLVDESMDRYIAARKAEREAEESKPVA